MIPNLPGQDAASIAATTLENVRGELIDVISKQLPTMLYLTSNDLVTEEPGSHVIQKPLMYGNMDTVDSYYPGDEFALERPSGFTRVSYAWSFVGGAMVMDGPTEFMNSSKFGIVNMVKGGLKQLQVAYKNKLSTMLLGDGTGNDGADLLGLELLVEDGTSWSTVGNIDSDTHEWWRNYYIDDTANAWETGLDANGIKVLENSILEMTKAGLGKPSVAITSLTQYKLYRDAIRASLVGDLTSLQNSKYADAGFGGLRIDGVPIIWDPEITTDDESWIFLNNDCINFIVGENKSFDVDPPMSHPYSDAEIFKAKMYGQLVLFGRRDACGRVKLSNSAT